MKIILYHASGVIIKAPDISRGRKNADFGQGFYLTPDRDFIDRWAGTNSVVNEYELDESGLSIHRFERGEEWFSYIYQNRRLEDALDSDVVIGPIANDTIFETLGIMSSGFLTKEEATKLLAIGPEYTQVAIKSEKALRQLKWVRARKLEGFDAERSRAEQEAYQKELARELEKLLA